MMGFIFSLCMKGEDEIFSPVVQGEDEILSPVTQEEDEIFSTVIPPTGNKVKEEVYKGKQ